MAREQTGLKGVLLNRATLIFVPFIIGIHFAWNEVRKRNANAYADFVEKEYNIRMHRIDEKPEE